MDIFNQLNVTKSINKQRLIYQLNFILVLQYLMGSVMAIVLFGACFVTGAAVLKVIGAPDYATMFWGTGLAIGAILDIAAMHLLIKINGDNSDNRKALHEFLTTRFPRISRMKNTKAYVRYQYHPKYIGVASSISCLFNGDDVYLNIISLGKGDGFLPFFGIFNYFRGRRMAKSFVRYILANAQKG